MRLSTSLQFRQALVTVIQLVRQPATLHLWEPVVALKLMPCFAIKVNRGGFVGIDSGDGQLRTISPGYVPLLVYSDFVFT
jgi:hypothetical protein